MIGDRIKKRIEDKGMTVSDFANKIGMRRESLYKVFEKDDLNTSVIKKASLILDTPISYFFEQPDANKSIASEPIFEYKTNKIKGAYVDNISEQIDRLTETVLSQQRTIEILVEKEKKRDVG